VEKMKKQTCDLEERQLEYSVRIVKKDILQETQELINFNPEIKIRSEATSLFDVQRWTFDVGRSV
jgi:hypothetical protein